MPRKRRRFIAKAEWAEVNGKLSYYRSKMELKYARYLETLKSLGEIKDFEHEPHVFWFEEIKRGIRCYLPDFKVIKNDDNHYWVEVKGYMDSASKTKINRFRKYYPNEVLIVVLKF